MRKSQYIAKMNRIAQLSNELDAAVREDFGRDAFVFVTDDEGIHIMTGDAHSNAGTAARQSHIKYSATVSHSLAIGAW